MKDQVHSTPVYHAQPVLVPPGSSQRLRGASMLMVILASCFVVIFRLVPTFPVPIPRVWPERGSISFQELQHLIKTTPSSQAIRRSSTYYSSGPHLAGANLSQVLWTKALWASFGVTSQIFSYDVYLNRPAGHNLTLLRKTYHGKPTGKDEVKVLYAAKLAEDALKEDPASCDPRRIPTFHGYSASGDVTAQYVYVNYGTYQDFEDLISANVSLKGKIAIAKYDQVWRGMKVMRAEQLGMVAVILYSDPGGDYFQESDGYRPYPYGYARQPSSVQRGSVLSINWQPGDPSTPGYPSLPGSPRVAPEDMVGIPRIPSLPISYEDSVPLLKALNDYGPLASSLGENWQLGGLEYKGVQYNIGPSPPEIVLRVVNNQVYTIAPIHNLIGVINGTEADEVVILGNHHDSWTLGGAGDPHSGSSALNEIVNSFGKALKKGWKPHRTLIFARWDAEEYGMTGSTEWVEQYLPWLSDAGVAYLNSDPGVTGSELYISAAPLLEHVIRKGAQSVLSPNQTTPGQTLGDLWSTSIGTLGGGSDYSAFIDHAGIASADLNFRPSHDAPAYHYHSNYDSITYMERIVDPDFTYHTALSQMWGLIAAELVESPILSFNATHYAIALRVYVEDIKKLFKQTHRSQLDENRFDNLTIAADRFREAATVFDREVFALTELLSHRGNSWSTFWQFWQRNALHVEAKHVNKKLRSLERQFLYDRGLDGRTWFKHAVFAPGFWEGYQGVTLPGLRESIIMGGQENIARWERIIIEAFNRARELLER